MEDKVQLRLRISGRHSRFVSLTTLWERERPFAVLTQRLNTTRDKIAARLYDIEDTRQVHTLATYVRGYVWWRVSQKSAKCY